MKKVLLTVFGGAAIVFLVLLFVNCLRTWNLSNISVGDMSEEFFDISLSNGYKKVSFANDLKYSDYGGEMIIEVDITNCTSPYSSLGEEYELVIKDGETAEESVYEEMKELFGVNESEVTCIYQATSELKRNLFSSAKPEHATTWVCITKSEDQTIMHMAYVE